MTALDWLLDSDPAIRWQELRDLADAPDDLVAVERSRIPTVGWGARLLALRHGDGQWEGSAHFPADGVDPGDGSQPWTATAYSLLLLRDFGLDPNCAQALETVALIDRNCHWENDGQPFFDGEVEPCINGMTVALGSYFRHPVESVVHRLLGDQLPDGGWNCWAEYGATVSSFGSTINVLEGLLAYEQATGGLKDVVAARRRGEQYLLERGLFRRRTTRQIVDEHWLRFLFPTRWHYDVLRALEYFRIGGDPPDPRMDEAFELVLSKQQPDGAWLLENTHPGEVHFALEDGEGAPSRWNTLRALRVLRWRENPLRVSR